MSRPPLLAFRPAEPADYPQIEDIRIASPLAAQWRAGEATDFCATVCTEADRISAFALHRTVAPDEHELLNLAVAPSARGRGIGAALVAHVTAQTGDWFLEVRESNWAARRLYEKAGFRDVGRRPAYYDEPREAAIVMKLERC